MQVKHILSDVLSHDLSVVFCGTAAGEESASVGHYYAGRGNSFWPTLHTVGITPRCLIPGEFRSLPAFGAGLTDMAKCTSGNDNVLDDCDFDVPAFIAKIKSYKPRVIAFNGKRAAAAFFNCSTGVLSYGQHRAQIGDTVIWLLPSTSSAAKRYWSVEPWLSLAQFVRRLRQMESKISATT